MMQITKTNTISGKEVYDLLNDARAIIINDGTSTLTYPSIDEVWDGFYTMEAKFTDEEGLIYEYEFIWDRDDSINIINGILFIHERYAKDVVGIELLETIKL